MGIGIFALTRSGDKYRQGTIPGYYIIGFITSQALVDRYSTQDSRLLCLRNIEVLQGVTT
jgi:hypothetical protein